MPPQAGGFKVDANESGERSSAPTFLSLVVYLGTVVNIQVLADARTPTHPHPGRSNVVVTKSGGAHTSRTMLLADLSTLLANCPRNLSQSDYRTAIIDDNVVGKGSLSSRQRTFRYLKEMYSLDIEDGDFRAFLRIWDRDLAGRPLTALLMASSRDPALAASAPPVVNASEGSSVTSHDLAEAVEETYPGSYSDSVLNKIGRNALSSWKQSGFLSSDRSAPAKRQEISPTAGSAAMALVIGSTDTVSGERLFQTSTMGLLHQPLARLHDLAFEASRKGLLDYRSRGQVTEIDLSALTAELDDGRLPMDDDRG